MLDESKRVLTVMNLEKSSYRLKDAANVWLYAVSGKFREAALRQMDNAPCAFKGECVIEVCHVDDLLVLVKQIDISQN